MGKYGAMEPEIIYGDWIVVDTSAGTYFVPGEFIDDKIIAGIKKDYEDEIDTEEMEKYIPAIQNYVPERITHLFDLFVETGYGARIQMPGYLDATDWAGVFATEQDALDYLEEQYGDDFEEEE